MEVLYNILHLSGAFCLIVFSVTGFALIVRWWGRLALLDSRVRFITAEIVNLKGYDNDPQHALMKLVRQRDFLLRKFGLSLEWLVSEMSSGGNTEAAALGGLKNDGETVGARIKTAYEFNEMLKSHRPPNAIVEIGNYLNLPRYENPPPPPPKKRTTENSTTTETRNG